MCRGALLLPARTKGAWRVTVSLTDYAGWLYGRPGVQPMLLELQDDTGADVLLLLTACWLGRCLMVTDPALWQALRCRQRPWHQQVVAPLRQVRRALADNPATAALYAQTKACELAAEWYQLEQLEQECRQQMRPGTDVLGESIQAQLAACGEAQGDQRLHRLAALAAAA